MIVKAPSFKTSDDKAHATLAEAQIHELHLILGLPLPQDADEKSRQLVEAMLKAKDNIVDVLTMTEKSRAKQRKVNGGTRKSRKTTQPSQVT